ncbi:MULTISPECIES: DUF2569 family protein [Bhargavaea]|uniref:DUF2569 family protein n=1 Tax=Bhargavaea changchunensis TaxID=2134037 RepID=A0ABW2NG11_9BACL|nr:DUF2569 family protein [Bhargavaea sp. CC-171006]
MNHETSGSRPEFKTDFRYAVVAGWLILPALYLLFSLFMVSSVVLSFNPLEMSGQDLWVYIIYLSLTFYYLFVILSWVQRKKRLPLLMIIAYLVEILLTLYAWFVGAGGLLGIGILMVWILYFASSRRVKATFIR